MVNLNK